MTSLDIEVALSNYFNPRVNLMVPNVSWGMWLHECDLLVITKAGYCYEVEIKISRADMRADHKKRHAHASDKIKCLYFAYPQSLGTCADLVPDRAGTITVEENLHCHAVRPALPNHKALPLTIEERYQIARLGTMRIWTLKEKMRNFWHTA